MQAVGTGSRSDGTRNADLIWSADLTTRSGTTVHVRPATASDKDLVTELFRHVSPEDRRFRFFGTVQQIGDEQITPMLADDDGTITFIAFNKETPIACCTLIDDLNGKSADVSLSIRSDWKGEGVSWTLLEHVLQYAAAHGLTTVTSLESGDDRIAIALEREMGFVARLSSASPIELVLSKRVD